MERLRSTLIAADRIMPQMQTGRMTYAVIRTLYVNVHLGLCNPLKRLGCLGTSVVAYLHELSPTPDRVSFFIPFGLKS